MAGPPTLENVIGPELTTAPGDSDLVVAVRCSGSADGSAYAGHDVVVHPDWSITTPHDIEAERVVAAFGGSVSCVDLVDRALPAARELMQLQARRMLPPIAVGPGGLWSPRIRAAGCCRGSVPLSRAEAAQHVRDARHVAALHGAREPQVRQLAAALLAAHGSRLDPPVPASLRRLVGRCVPDLTDLVRLWDEGVHPALVGAIHRALGVGIRPLRAEFYLTVLKWETDLSWVHEHAVRLPETAFEAQPLRAFPRPAIERIAPDVRAAWLVTGIASHLIEDLHAKGFSAADIETLSAETGRQPMGYATELVGWLRAGCRPSVRQLLDLHATGVSAFYRPSSPAIARAYSAIGPVLPGATITDIGLLLAVVGSVPETVRWAQGGYRDPAVVARLIKDGWTATDASTTTERTRTSRAHAS